MSSTFTFVLVHSLLLYACGSTVTTRHRLNFQDFQDQNVFHLFITRYQPLFCPEIFVDDFLNTIPNYIVIDHSPKAPVTHQNFKDQNRPKYSYDKECIYWVYIGSASLPGLYKWFTYGF